MTEDTLRIQLQLAKQLCDSIALKIALLMPHYAMFPKEVAIAQRLFQRDLLSIESVTSFITNRHKLYTISRKLRASRCDSPGTSTDEVTASIKSFMEVHVHAPEESCCHQRANLSVWSSWKKTAIAVWRSCTHNRCLQRPAAPSLRRNSLHLGYASGRACDSHLGGTVTSATICCKPAA